VNCPDPQDAVSWVQEFYDSKFGFIVDKIRIEPFNPTPDFEKQMVAETMEEARRMQRQGPRVHRWEDDTCTSHLWERTYESMFDPSQDKYNCRICGMKKEDYENNKTPTTTSPTSPPGIGINAAGSISRRKSHP
jgi:hypothetical protein